MNVLMTRVVHQYPRKAAELAARGLSKPPHDSTGRGRKGRAFTHQESSAVRVPIPGSVWRKALDIRKDIQMHIAPAFIVKY